MTREQAKNILAEYQNVVEDVDDDLFYALRFAIADMESLQDILTITDGIMTE